MSEETPSTGTDRAAETRNRILQAALSEFAREGLAGARTERIAAAAEVNKALLYYYFDSKEKLYLAALETIAARIRDTSLAVFLREDSSPGERILRAALNHFDRILSQREFQSLMQQEMIRMHKGEKGVMPLLVKRVFEPVLIMYRSMVREGIANGELIDVDWMQMQLATLGANVFYFLSAPIWGQLLDVDVFAPEVLNERRRILLDYLGKALFVDREHGAVLAAKVFADTPMPPLDGDRFKFGGNA